MSRPPLAFARGGFTRIPCLIKHGIWVKSGVGGRLLARVTDTQRVFKQNLRFYLGLVACLASFAGATGVGFYLSSSGRAGRAASPRAFRARGCAALVARPGKRSRPSAAHPRLDGTLARLGFQPRRARCDRPEGAVGFRHAASFGTKLAACLT